MEPKKPYIGKVYIMRNMRNGMYKIGFTTKNPEYREHTLQSQEPEVKLIDYWNGTDRDERKLHGIFSSKRARGEWFVIDQADILKIADYFSSK